MDKSNYEENEKENLRANVVAQGITPQPAKAASRIAVLFEFQVHHFWPIPY